MHFINIYLMRKLLEHTAKCRIGLVLIIGIVWQPAVDKAAGQTDPIGGLSSGIWMPAVDTTKVKTKGIWQQDSLQICSGRAPPDTRRGCRS